MSITMGFRILGSDFENICRSMVLEKEGTSLVATFIPDKDAFSLTFVSAKKRFRFYMTMTLIRQGVDIKEIFVPNYPFADILFSVFLRHYNECLPNAEIPKERLSS